jgi:hypothetical protein
MLTKERWYLIFKHNRILGEPRIAMDEVRGESHAVSYVERLDAQLSDEERIAGWSYERAGHGTAKPQRNHPPTPRRQSTKRRSYTGR